MIRHARLALTLLLSWSATATLFAQPEPMPEPPLERVIRIIDSVAGEEVTMHELLRRLHDADAIFLGETHLDRTTHRVQHWIYESLLERRDGRVVLAMEMFERDVQAHVDAYLADEIDEAAFLEKARPWSNYASDYRPAVEAAKRAGAPVVAANFPRWLGRKVRSEESLAELTEEERRWMPAKLLPNSAAYWERFDRAVRGHMGGANASPEERIYSMQCLWDNAMGEACALALEQHEGYSVVHLNGGFHTAYGEGTAAQFLARRPGARMVTIQIRSTSDLAAIDPEPTAKEEAEADFLIFVEARGRSVQEGTHAVNVSREFEYFVREPEGAPSGPLPLVVWMHREGLRAQDALRYLQLAFDEPVLLVAIEAPFPQLEDDLYLGGRWYWEPEFSDHVGSVASGLVRIIGRLHDEYPIDSERSVVVGEGTAGTALAYCMLYSRGWLPIEAIAIAPSEYGKLRQGGLPAEREPKGPERIDLRVWVGESDRDWWEKELADYADTGLRTELKACPSTALEVENALREILGFEAVDVPATATRVRLRHDSLRARFWADLEARARLAAGERVVVVAPDDEGDAALMALPGEGHGDLAFDLSELGSGVRVPRPAGAFGGTTVLVTYPGLSDEERTAWEEFAARPELGSRFYRVVVAHVDAEPSVATVFAELASSGRRNVMVVPAAFCATPDEMRALRSVVTPVADGAALSWSPGLGGAIFRRHERGEHSDD